MKTKIFEIGKHYWVQEKENGTWRLMLCYFDQQGTLFLGYYKWGWDYDDEISSCEWVSIQEHHASFSAEIANTPEQYLERIKDFNSY